MDERLKEMLAQAGMSDLAGGLFKQENYAAMYSNISSLPDNLRSVFGAERLIGFIAEDIEEWKRNAPEGKHMVIHLRTPHGEIMDVGFLKATGAQGFIAKGHVNGLQSMVTGHISTLLLFCTYEETKGTKSVGFKIVTDASNAPQKESLPTTPDSK